MEEAKPMTECWAKVEKRLRWMYQVASRNLDTSKEDVEEAVSNAYLAFMQKCTTGEFQHRATGIGEYLKKQVIWQCVAIRRRKGHETLLDTDDLDTSGLAPGKSLLDPDPTHSPEGNLLSNVLSEELTSCLDSLPDYQRAILLLDADEWTDDAKAKKLELAVGTVKTRLSAARRSLRNCLEQKGYRL